jgi:hypothetical protein
MRPATGERVDEIDVRLVLAARNGRQDHGQRADSACVDRRTRVGVAALLALLVIVAAIAFGASRLGEGSERHVVTYEVELMPRGELRNVTLLLPLPTTGAEDTLAHATWTGPSAEGWTTRAIETERGPMLEARVDRLAPDGGREPTRLVMAWTREARLDTANPGGDTPLLAPMENETEVACDFPHPEDDADLRCGRFASWMSLEAEGDASLAVTVSLGGTNERWWLGWTSDSYRVRASRDDAPRGWGRMEGSLVTGEG